MAKFLGYNGVTQTDENFTWSKTDGWTSQVVYEGSRKHILGIAGNVTNWADEISIDTSGPTATLTASVGRDVTGQANDSATDVTTSWDLNSNEVQADLRMHPSAIGLSDTQITAVERAANKAKSASETLAASSFIDGSWNGDQKVLFWFFIRDQFNWLDFEFALTKRELVTSYYSIGVSMAGVGKLWTSDQITAAEGALPAAMAASVLSIGNNTTPAYANANMANNTDKWYYRWLKKAPNITQTSNGKFERTTEYWLGLWPTWLYPAYS